MYNEEDPDHRVEDREDSGMYVNEGSAMSAMLQEVPEEKKEQILREIHAKTGIKGTFNTGAKGVITDYKEAKISQREQLEREQQYIRQAIMQQALTVDAKEDTSDESFDIDSDDEIFTAIREARMKELQRLGSGEREDIANSMKTTLQTKQQNKSYPRLSQAQFVDFVETEPAEVTHIGLCMRLNSCIEDLAKRYPGSKFGKILSTDAHAGLNFTITDDVLPVLQVYRNGKLVTQLESLGEELRSGFDVDDVDEYLQEKGILDKSDAVLD